MAITQRFWEANVNNLRARGKWLAALPPRSLAAAHPYAVLERNPARPRPVEHK